MPWVILASTRTSRLQLCFIDEHTEAHGGSGILPEVTEMVSEELGLHQGQQRWLFPEAHAAHPPPTG